MPAFCRLTSSGIIKPGLPALVIDTGKIQCKRFSNHGHRISSSKDIGMIAYKPKSHQLFFWHLTGDRQCVKNGQRL